MNKHDIEHLVTVLEDAKASPVLIRDMVLEGDARDQIAYILGLPATAVTLRDIDRIFTWLKEHNEDELYEELDYAYNGVSYVTNKL